jgi:hypothetical protein
MEKLSFNSRETYLAARKQWKLDYAELSTKIRQLKVEFKAAHRELSKIQVVYPIWENPPALRSQWYGARAVANGVGAAINRLSHEATEAIEILQQAKQEAARQYEQNKHST